MVIVFVDNINNNMQKEGPNPAAFTISIFPVICL